jgi:spore germination cell wall hydrolase CwlJ-like protein
MTKTLVLSVVLLSASSLAQAEAPAPRLITTSGDADVKVMPERTEFTLGIETRDKDLAAAKKQNSERLKKTMDSSGLRTTSNESGSCSATSTDGHPSPRTRSACSATVNARPWSRSRRVPARIRLASMPNISGWRIS